MKILFFTKGDRRLPSARTRAFLVSDYLKKSGMDSQAHQVKTRAWWNVSFGRIRELIRNSSLLMSLKKGDLVFLQRTVHQIDFLFLILIRKIVFRRGYAFDFDDAIFLEKGHADFKARLIITHADVVFAGSHFLKEYAERFNPNVHVFTTVFDTEYVYLPKEHTGERTHVIIGWTGTPVHYDNMQLLVEPLRRLCAEGLSVQLTLVGGGPRIPELFRDIPDLSLSSFPFLPSDTIWSDPKELVRYVQDFDIGVYPLQKTEWNKGKDAHKAKEYMACGVAAVLSDWGENPILLRNGVDAVLVDSEDDWYRELKKLITDPSYRRKFAEAGRSFAETKCSFKVFVPKMLELMKGSAI